MFEKYLEMGQERAVKRQMKREDELYEKKLKTEAEEKLKVANGRDEKIESRSRALDWTIVGLRSTPSYRDTPHLW